MDNRLFLGLVTGTVEGGSDGLLEAVSPYLGSMLMLDTQQFAQQLVLEWGRDLFL